MKYFILTMPFLIFSFFAKSAFSTTYYVAAQSNSADIQYVVNLAVAGDIIILNSGDHYITTPIVLGIGKNNITLRGQNGAIVRKAPNAFYAAAFEISGNYNVIDNINLDGGNLPEAGIIVYGQNNTISNSKVHNCGNAAARGAGILLHNSNNPVCSYNTVIGCQVYYNYMVGISQNGHSDGTIRDNQIYENGAEGLTIDIGSHNNYVYNNWIHKNNTANRGVGGVGIDFSNGNQIIGNTIDFTVHRSGITFQNNIGGCDGTIVRDNRINFNADYGILERWTQYANTNSLFQNNELTGNNLGTHTIIYSGSQPFTARKMDEANSGQKVSFSQPVSIYPNPVKQNLRIDFTGQGSQNVNLIISNFNGQVLLNKKLNGLFTDIINVEGWNSGTYLLMLKGEEINYKQKLIIIQ